MKRMRAIKAKPGELKLAWSKLPHDIPVICYAWICEFINKNHIHDFTGHEAAFAVYIAEKACEWQREQLSDSNTTPLRMRS